jgi:hypothetical protein
MKNPGTSVPPLAPAGAARLPYLGRLLALLRDSRLRRLTPTTGVGAK